MHCNDTSNIFFSPYPSFCQVNTHFTNHSGRFYCLVSRITTYQSRYPFPLPSLGTSAEYRYLTYHFFYQFGRMARWKPLLSGTLPDQLIHRGWAFFRRRYPSASSLSHIRRTAGRWFPRRRFALLLPPLESYFFYKWLIRPRRLYCDCISTMSYQNQTVIRTYAAHAIQL